MSHSANEYEDRGFYTHNERGNNTTTVFHCHTVQRTRVIESVDGILQLPVHGPPRAMFITQSFHALHSCYNVVR
jgi:hypothetical protein